MKVDQDVDAIPKPAITGKHYEKRKKLITY